MSVDFEHHDINDNYDVTNYDKFEFFPRGVVFEIFQQAPSPSKDYCQLHITLDKVYTYL